MHFNFDYAWTGNLLLNFGGWHCHIYWFWLFSTIFNFKMVCWVIKSTRENWTLNSYDYATKKFNAKIISRNTVTAVVDILTLTAHLDQYSFILSIFLVTKFLSSRKDFFFQKCVQRSFKNSCLVIKSRYGLRKFIVH